MIGFLFWEQYKYNLPYHITQLTHADTKNPNSQRLTVYFKMHLNHMYSRSLTKSGASDRWDGKGFSFTSVWKLWFKYMSGSSISEELDDSTRK